MARTGRHSAAPGDTHGAGVPGDPRPGTLAYARLSTPSKPEKKPGELNAWGGKIRPIAESIVASESQFRDPPREISRLMGHKPYLDSIGAMFVHRVGLFQGIGWVLPYSGVKNDWNYVKVTLNNDGQTFDLSLGKVNTESNWQPETIEIQHVVTQIPGRELRATYERETIDQ